MTTHKVIHVETQLEKKNYDTKMKKLQDDLTKMNEGVVNQKEINWNFIKKNLEIYNKRLQNLGKGKQKERRPTIKREPSDFDDLRLRLEKARDIGNRYCREYYTRCLTPTVSNAKDNKQDAKRPGKDQIMLGRRYGNQVSKTNIQILLRLNNKRSSFNHYSQDMDPHMEVWSKKKTYTQGLGDYYSLRNRITLMEEEIIEIIKLYGRKEYIDEYLELLKRCWAFEKQETSSSKIEGFARTRIDLLDECLSNKNIDDEVNRITHETMKRSLEYKRKTKIPLDDSVRNLAKDFQQHAELENLDKEEVHVEAVDNLMLMCLSQISEMRSGNSQITEIKLRNNEVSEVKPTHSQLDCRLTFAPKEQKVEITPSKPPIIQTMVKQPTEPKIFMEPGKESGNESNSRDRNQNSKSERNPMRSGNFNEIKSSFEARSKPIETNKSTEKKFQPGQRLSNMSKMVTEDLLHISDYPSVKSTNTIKIVLKPKVSKQTDVIPMTEQEPPNDQKSNNPIELIEPEEPAKLNEYENSKMERNYHVNPMPDIDQISPKSVSFLPQAQTNISEPLRSQRDQAENEKSISKELYDENDRGNEIVLSTNKPFEKTGPMSISASASPHKYDESLSQISGTDQANSGLDLSIDAIIRFDEMNSAFTNFIDRSFNSSDQDPNLIDRTPYSIHQTLNLIDTASNSTNHASNSIDQASNSTDQATSSMNRSTNSIDQVSTSIDSTSQIIHKQMKDLNTIMDEIYDQPVQQEKRQSVFSISKYLNNWL